MRGFGMLFDLERGTNRKWFVGDDGIKRWVDNNDPVKPSKPESDEAAKYKSLMIDMAKMYFHLREARCIHVPEPEEDEDSLLNIYKEHADRTCEEIRALVKGA